MRSTNRLAMAAAALLAISTLSSAPPARAQGSDGSVYAWSLIQRPLGSAALVYDPVTRRLDVSNMGSSGLDGVQTPLPDGGTGLSLEWVDYAAKYYVIGCTHRHTVSAVVSGSTVSQTVGELTVTRTAAGEDLDCSFPLAASTDLIITGYDATGGTVYQGSAKISMVHVTATPGGAAVNQKRVTLNTENSFRDGFLIEFDAPVAYQKPTSDGGAVPITLSALRVCPADGSDWTPIITKVATRAAWPIGSPPGSFALATIGIVQPCAGCVPPEENATTIGLGNAQFTYTGIAGRKVGTGNMGSSGLDGSEHGKLMGGLSHGTEFAPVNAIDVDVNDVIVSVPDSEVITLDGSVALTSARDITKSALKIALKLTSDASGTQALITPDFSPIGASAYQLTLLAGGATVYSGVGPASGFVAGLGTTTFSSKLSAGQYVHLNLHLVCITAPCPGWPVTVGGATYVADEILLTPVSLPGDPPPPSIAGAMSTKITTLGISAMTCAATVTDSAANSNYSTAASEPVARPARDIAAPRLSPNPARGAVSVGFSLPRAARASVAITDIAGRQVRQLASGAWTAGVHDMRWDGRDAAGRRAPAGVYLVRLQSGGQTRLARLVRLP